MKSAFDLCSSSDKFDSIERDKIHFYTAVRSILFKLTKGDAPDISQMNEKVRKMVEEAVISDGIEELFETGRNITLEILSDEYIAKINNIKLPNTKIKILEKLLTQAIGDFKKVNKVKAVEFSERLNKVIDAYNNRRQDEALVNDVLDNILDELATLLVDLKNEQNSFENMGINYEEKAFYDILKVSAQKYNFEFPDDKMLEMAKHIKELIDDKAKYPDWENRADIKAKLKVGLRMILDKYNYPPVPIDEIYKDIFEQAENFKKNRV